MTVMWFVTEVTEVDMFFSWPAARGETIYQCNHVQLATVSK